MNDGSGAILGEGAISEIRGYLDEVKTAVSGMKSDVETLGGYITNDEDFNSFKAGTNRGASYDSFLNSLKDMINFYGDAFDDAIRKTNVELEKGSRDSNATFDFGGR